MRTFSRSVVSITFTKPSAFFSKIISYPILFSRFETPRTFIIRLFSDKKPHFTAFGPRKDYRLNSGTADVPTSRKMYLKKRRLDRAKDTRPPISWPYWEWNKGTERWRWMFGHTPYRFLPIWARVYKKLRREYCPKITNPKRRVFLEKVLSWIYTKTHFTMFYIGFVLEIFRLIYTKVPKNLPLYYWYKIEKKIQLTWGIENPVRFFKREYPKLPFYIERAVFSRFRQCRALYRRLVSVHVWRIKIQVRTFFVPVFAGRVKAWKNKNLTCFSRIRYYTHKKPLCTNKTKIKLTTPPTGVLGWFFRFKANIFSKCRQLRAVYRRTLGVRVWSFAIKVREIFITFFVYRLKRWRKEHELLCARVTHYSKVFNRLAYSSKRVKPKKPKRRSKMKNKVPKEFRYKRPRRINALGRSRYWSKYRPLDRRFKGWHWIDNSKPRQVWPVDWYLEFILERRFILDPFDRLVPPLENQKK